MAVPPLFIPECHVDTVLTRTLLIYRHDFDDFINHQHGVSKVANEMQRQWQLFGTSRQVVGIVDRDKKLHDIAYLSEFNHEVGGSLAADAPHSIRRHPARPTQHLIVLNPACDTWIWQAATAAGLLMVARGLPNNLRTFIEYCKTKGIENDPPLVDLLASIRRARPAVYAELGEFRGRYDGLELGRCLNGVPLYLWVRPRFELHHLPSTAKCMRHRSRKLTSFAEGLWKLPRHAGHWLVLLMAPQLLLAQTPLRPAPQAKLAPGLQTAAAQHAARTVRVSVTDQAAFLQWARQHLPAARVSQPSASAHTLVVAGLDAAALVQLAACPLVDFVDVADRPAHGERQLNNSDLSVNAIAAVQARFPQLAGQGLTVSVKELPFDPNDVDFRGRVVSPGAFPGPASDHATAMATLIGGAGNSHPLGRGVARQVRLATSDFARLLPDDGQQLTQAGVSVQNHSYGVANESYYGVEAQEYDRQLRQFPALLHVFSSGNVGPQAGAAGPYAGIAAVANITGQFKMSKNTLTVGATDPSGQVAALSSRGPAHDGRVKPELVAYGEGGSSESAALVSGIGALLQQTYRDQHSGALPPAALVKAVLLNSADDLGRPEVDFVGGFGQADALGAINTMRGGQFFSGATTQGNEQIYRIIVPAGQQQLKATLVWADPEASANAARALVNDLDLELVAPATGQRYRPWVLSAYPNADSLARPARRRPDHVNNAEQITLAVPAAGTYELHVRGFSMPQGPQTFSLAYEVSPPGLEWISPQRAGNVRPASSSTLRWHWSGPATTARLEYRPIGPSPWRTVVPAVALEQNRLAWAVPDTTALVQLRLVAGSQVFASDTFAIVRAPALQVGYTCPDETLLQWARVPGVTQYQVYQLGPAALLPLVRTVDTLLVLDRAQMAATHYYAVAPVLQNKLTEPSGTIDFTTQGTACYFRSFRPRQLVTDAVTFDLEIGSTYRLQSATLERLGASGYEAVRTLAPVRQLALVFTDQLPGPGRYQYRIRLETTAGQVLHSQVEEVYYVRPGELLVFPNPVAAGGSLSLIAGGQGEVQMTLYDALGRFQRTATANGSVNIVSTSGLLPGLYLLRVQTESGVTTRRVVIL